MTSQVHCAGAPSGDTGHWHGIDWASCYREVRRLQARIVKATQEGRWGKVKALQWLLTHSFSGKALAVRRVTENQGRKHPASTRLRGRHRRPSIKPSKQCVVVVTRRSHCEEFISPKAMASKGRSAFRVWRTEPCRRCICLHWNRLRRQQPIRIPMDFAIQDLPVTPSSSASLCWQRNARHRGYWRAIFRPVSIIFPMTG